MALLLLAILALPVGLLYLLSRLAGWPILAARYPAYRPPPRPRHWLGSGVFRGWIGYNGGLVVSANACGLYLSTLPGLLSCFHAPVFIPWSEIHAIRKGRRFWATVYEIHTQRAPEVDFALRTKTFTFVRAHAMRAGVPGDYCV
jgi:hypothetical protein